RDDLDPVLAGEMARRVAVHLEDGFVASTHDQKRGRTHGVEPRAGEVGPAAAHNAAPAPVLAPKKPTGSARASSWSSTQVVAAPRRPARSGMSNTFARFVSSSGER